MRRTIATIALLLLGSIPAVAARFPANAPATTNNDDSCDVGVYPAATLLLPYFEVDFNSPQTTARTTIFTITNVSPNPQIAKVTLWTDWGFPLLGFSLFFTGYDVQALNLYDVIARGLIAPTGPNSGGTSIATPPGELSHGNLANPNFAKNVPLDCARGALPGFIPPALLTDLRTGLSAGSAFWSCGGSSPRIGGSHSNAIGYATVDVVATCSQTLPTQPKYFDEELLYDNVLAGDYAQIDPNPASGNYAGGNPLVHIRAIPEGGQAGVMRASNLPFTFYDRETANGGGARGRDRRQPLSSAFAARFVEGGAGGMSTDLLMWREPALATAVCADAGKNAELPIAEVVRFDEHENPTTFALPLLLAPRLEATAVTSRTPTTRETRYPPLAGTGDAGGWLFLNLHQSGGPLPYRAPDDRPTQNWVVVSMFAEGRYSVAMDASPLGNGCSPAMPISEADGGPAVIGPLP